MIFHKYINVIFALITAICFALCLVGCKSKKVATQSYSRNDTLITKSFDYVSQPIETNYEIKLECDTITGKVKPVNQKQTSGSNSASLSIANNKLSAKLYTGQSKIKTDTIYKTKYKTKTETSEIVRNVTSLWHWWAHLVSLLAIAALLYLKFGSPVSWIGKILFIFTN